MRKSFNTETNSLLNHRIGDLFMRGFPISHVRGLIRRASCSRLYVVPALSRSSLTISQSEQTLKEGNFDCNVLDYNETGVLRVLTSMKDDPYVAFSFLKQIGGNGALPSVQAYATVIRIVSDWGLDKETDSLLVELIKKGDEERGFSLMDLLETIGEAQKEGKGSLSRISSALVNAYANLEMFDQAIDIFFHMGCAPDIKALNFMMNRMLASGKANMAVSSFWQIARLGLDADADTYLLLVHAYRKLVCGLCNEMNIDAAENVVLDMEKLGVDPGVYVYSAIIEGHLKNINIPKALDVFEEILEKNINIKGAIVSSILQCCCQMGKFSEAFDLFKKCRALNISLDRVCYNVAFDALGKLGKVEEAIELFREMTGGGIAPDIINYTTLIGGCCLHGKTDYACDLMTEMEGTCIIPDILIRTRYQKRRVFIDYGKMYTDLRYTSRTPYED